MASTDAPEPGPALMIPLRLTWATLTWLAYQILIALPLLFLGLILVPLALKCRVRRPSRINGREIVTAPAWLELVGNEEDGFEPAWYAAAHPTWSPWWRSYVWAALRNSVGNLRFVRWLHPPPVPARIRSIVREHWQLCWQGPLYHLQIAGGGWYFLVGWHYVPEDAKGIRAEDWRRFGCGFQLSAGRT